jgi:hypothetical protein
MRVVSLAILGLGVVTACAWMHRHQPADAETWNASKTHDGVGALDGQAFDVTMNEVGKSDTERETMEFRGGRFHSEGCDEYGFTTGPYSATKSGDTVAFVADTSSMQEGVIHWQGSVRGDQVDGRYTWNKSGQSPRDYTFHGTRKKS